MGLIVLLVSISIVVSDEHLFKCLVATCISSLEKRLLSSSVQFSSVAQSCPTLCDRMNRSTPGLPVHQHLREFTQTHVRRVRDAIQPSHPRCQPTVQSGCGLFVVSVLGCVSCYTC